MRRSLVSALDGVETNLHFLCPDCGLLWQRMPSLGRTRKGELRYDYDAAHCKHCGRALNIESEGE